VFSADPDDTEQAISQPAVDFDTTVIRPVHD